MKVELLSVFGDDLMITNAARVSYGKFKDTLDEKDARLINFLVEHKHTSPFRHPQLQFRLSVPIFVERQLFKHQIGWSANSISGRYVDFSDKYHLIELFRLQAKDSKQGSGNNLSVEDNKVAQEIYKTMIDVCANGYKKLLELGVAKEQARAILPIALETQFIWTGSLQAFLHLCSLRLKNDTQQETREIVTEMLKQVIDSNKFTFTLKAFKIV